MAEEAVRAVVGQLEVWWFGAVTMRMAGLTDDEYFWKPVPDAYCLEPGADGLHCSWPPGSQGEAVPPVTTIAWRMAHVAQGCFENRWHEYFGEPVADWQSQPFATTATDALAYLERWKTQWCDALRAAGDAGLWEPLGERGPNIEIMQLGNNDPFINMALHINREVMHHGAEICLLRDLYRARSVT